MTTPEAICCERIDDIENVVSGSNSSRKCSRCGSRVFTAPSSERLLQQNPNLLIVCHPCVAGEDHEIVNPEPLPEQIEELQTLRPNTQRGRN